MIFVNGCFWHKHKGCRYFAWPKTNVDFWYSKINGNVQRDKLTETQLIESGWKVIVVWECELKRDVFFRRMDKLIKEIKDQEKHVK